MALMAFALFARVRNTPVASTAAPGAAVAVGVLLGGLQLLPTADAAAHSVRMRLSSDFAQTFSLHPINLLQLFSPYSLDQGAYSESDADAVSRIRHLLGRHPARRGDLGVDPAERAAGAAVTHHGGHCVCRGEPDPGARTLRRRRDPAHVRAVLQSLRAPVRYIVLVQFALAILAALTLDDLLAIADGQTDAPAGPMAALWIPTALGVATVARPLGTTAADRQARVRERERRNRGARDCGLRHAARLSGRTPGALGARRTGRRHGRGPRRVGHRIHLP